MGGVQVGIYGLRMLEGRFGIEMSFRGGEWVVKGRVYGEGMCGVSS